MIFMTVFRAGGKSTCWTLLLFLLPALLVACEQEKSTETPPQSMVPILDEGKVAPESESTKSPANDRWVLETTFRGPAPQPGRMLEVQVYWRENSPEEYGEPVVSRRVDLALYDSLSGDPLATASNTLLIPEFFEERMEDPFRGIRIEEGGVVVETGFWPSMGSWSMSKESYTFRPQDGCFRLIAYEGWLGDRRDGTSVETRFNLLTGEVLWTLESRGEDGGGIDTEILGTLTSLTPVCFGAMADWTPPSPPAESPN